ncbi:short-chain dehydrogenase [Melampsora larici-populina 98AG31]|uniref:Short-chain dehydrogenase n=1 Tax=Melampsora larici-populina (strain 98AG31 / pathotype 3-4-7) TaxID=747676 RepID=F4RI35_MELLP|nr:short-chain dehydrogenase [Melampsora larici-populina 98AG31]EGG07930.1 short-chain dehydrogenase [Melampsora larici-populina 98AG31]
MAKRPTIILTGASKGIGLATVKILLAEPFSANVITLSRSTSPDLQELAKSYPEQLRVHEGDVTKDEDNETVVKSAIDKFGTLDGKNPMCSRISSPPDQSIFSLLDHHLSGLILNAGIMELGRISETSMDSWKRVFEVNFFSLLSILHLAIPHLRTSKGRVVFVSSGASVSKVAGLQLHKIKFIRIRPVSDHRLLLTNAATSHTAGMKLRWASYNTSKAAMNSLARTLANEEPELTSIAVRPGVVDTDMQVHLREHGSKDMKAEELDKHLKLHANNQLLPPSKPGYVIAALSINTPIHLNGEFLSWDSAELSDLTLSIPGK